MPILACAKLKPEIQWVCLNKLQYKTEDSISKKIVKIVGFIFLGIFAATADLIRHGYLHLKPKKVETLPDRKELDNKITSYIKKALLLVSIGLISFYVIKDFKAATTTAAPIILSSQPDFISLPLFNPNISYANNSSNICPVDPTIIERTLSNTQNFILGTVSTLSTAAMLIFARRRAIY